MIRSSKSLHFWIQLKPARNWTFHDHQAEVLAPIIQSIVQKYLVEPNKFATVICKAIDKSLWKRPIKENGTKAVEKPLKGSKGQQTPLESTSKKPLTKAQKGKRMGS